MTKTFELARRMNNGMVAVLETYRSEAAAEMARALACKARPGVEYVVLGEKSALNNTSTLDKYMARIDNT